MPVPLTVQMCRHPRDIQWLAGLLEGEGCFKFNRKTINITLVMTDRDVVDRAARILSPTAKVTEWSLSGCRRKTPFYTGVSGNLAAGWMMTLYPMLGSRRRAKVRELLAMWISRKPRYGENTKCGHMGRPHTARGMCSQCYEKSRWPARSLARRAA